MLITLPNLLDAEVGGANNLKANDTINWKDGNNIISLL